MSSIEAAGEAALQDLAGPAAPDEDDEDRRPPYVWLLVLALAATAVAVAAPGFADDPGAAAISMTALALLPVFGLAEIVVIHLPTLRSAHGHTLREVPAVVGLTFLTPQAYVWVYVLGAVVALAVFTHMRGVKLAFNTALFAFEASVGVVIYHAILQGGDPFGPVGWLAALSAVIVTDLLSAAAVTLAITVTEAEFDGGVLREALRSGLAAACINTCVALLVATLIVVRPESLALLGVVVALLVMGYRVYTALARGGARTQLLYRFVERTAAAQEPDEVIREVLAEAAGLMSAETAHLVEVVEEASDRVLRCRTYAGGQVESAVFDSSVAADAWWQEALRGQSVLRRNSHHQHSDVQESSVVRPSSARDGVAAPLRTKDGVRAALVVCDRAFDKETFGEEDLQVFETLAAHAAVALERADSVGRLERLVEQRAYDALHDPLSGLPNRRAFNEAVDRAMDESAGHGGARGVVLLLDLDDFKDVNDTLGHSAGDRLITVSGERLRTNAHGMVARLGGDEFAVLLPGLTITEGVAHAQELYDVLSAPVPLGEVELIVSSSIGVAELSTSVTTAEELLAQADVAMYTAKADRSGVAVYRPEAGDSVARRLALAADLPGAIEAGELDLWFQPQAEATSGRVTGFEALLRWKHPVFGMVPPPEVIAVAQRTGRVRLLTDAMIRRALEARRSWAEAGYAVAVSVNVTPGDISDPMLVHRVEHELTRASTAPDALVLEVTESDAMKDPERSIEVLSALERVGVNLSIDDFGTGYSSLAYLDRLPVHEVKIDQSFVFRVERGEADVTIMGATVGLAHDLGLKVVAEGIETENARALVRDLGVDIFQGYGLARPMPEAQVLTWLQRQSPAADPGARPHAARALADAAPATTPTVATTVGMSAPV